MKKTSEILEHVNSMYNLNLPSTHFYNLLALMKRAGLVISIKLRREDVYRDDDVKIIYSVMKQHYGDRLPFHKAIEEAVKERYGEQTYKWWNEWWNNNKLWKTKKYAHGTDLYNEIYKEVSSYAPEIRLLGVIFRVDCYKDWIMEFLLSHPPQGDEHKYKMNAIEAVKQQLEQDYKLGELRTAIGETLNTLTPRERRVLQLRFGLEEDGKPRTLREVGEELECSKERARQINNQALKRLRYISRSGTLKLKNFLNSPRERMAERIMEKIESSIEEGKPDDVFLHKLSKLLK